MGEIAEYTRTQRNQRIQNQDKPKKKKRAWRLASRKQNQFWKRFRIFFFLVHVGRRYCSNLFFSAHVTGHVGVAADPTRTPCQWRT